MIDYEKTIEVLQNRVRELERLIRPVNAVAEPVKWQPTSGDWCIYGTGEICEDGTSEESQDFGTERQTKEQAERAAVEMRRFNRLLALRDELCGDEVVNWTDNGSNKWILYFDNKELVKDDQIIITDCIFSTHQHFCLCKENINNFDNWFMFQRILI